MLTTTETLFGGLLIVVAIFFTGRRFGLSHYWSGILSGSLPFLAYLGYSARHWPGGDVLAIHLVVFMATAGVMGVFGNAQRKKEKMHWAPKAFIIFFSLLVVFNAVLLSVATHGLPAALTSWILPNPDQEKVNTVFPGIVPHDRNKLYESHQKRVEQQRQLGWKVEIDGLDQLKAGQPTQLVLKAVDKQGGVIIPDQATVGFWRMANSKDDHRTAFKPGADGRPVAEIVLSAPGRWIIEVYIARGQDTYLARQSLLVD